MFLLFQLVSLCCLITVIATVHTISKQEVRTRRYCWKLLCNILFIIFIVCGDHRSWDLRYFHFFIMLFFRGFQIFLWPFFFTCSINRFTCLFLINYGLLRAFFNFECPFMMSFLLSFNWGLNINWHLVNNFFICAAHSSVLPLILI